MRDPNHYPRWLIFFHGIRTWPFWSDEDTALWLLGVLVALHWRSWGVLADTSLRRNFLF